MACERRQRTGSCIHHQCEFAGETENGYECVEVQGGFCEVGLDCLEKCDHSFPAEREDEANAVFEAIYG